jgi:hypothetical protein
MTDQTVAQIIAELRAEVAALGAEHEAMGETIAAIDAALDELEEALGEGGGTSPPEPEPDAVIFAVEEPLTTPMHFPEGAWRGIQTLLAVVEFDGDADGKHDKIAGAASSHDSRGAMGLGRKPDGNLEGWVVGASGQFIQPTGGAASRKASFVMWRFGDNALDILDLAFDDRKDWQQVNPPVAEADGAAVLGAGYWQGNVVDPLRGTMFAASGWSRVLSDEEVARWIEAHAHLIEDAPEPPIVGSPPNGGGGGNLEPIDQSALHVAVEAGTVPRQSWHGFGYGLNGWEPAATAFPRVRTRVEALTEDINAKIMRIFTPEAPEGCLKAYLPYWNLLKQHGVDTIFASCFLYRRHGSPASIAEGVKKCIDGGMDAEHWIITAQNEPDGNPANEVVGDFVGQHRDIRKELDARGLQRVKLVGLEWRHPSNRGPQEFDAYDRAGLAGADKAVADGCLHIYDKAPDQALYDDRWAKRGGGIWSTELGNNGSPSAQARMLAGINHGAVCELIHYCMIATSTPNAEQLQQSLLDWNGGKRPWYGGLQVLSRPLLRGTIFRRCSSSDRPPGLPEPHARWMVRNAAQTGGRNPRQQGAAGLRPDGRWVVLAVNTTHGSDGFNPYTSGHYAATKQQITVAIPELAGRGGAFQAQRADSAGGTSAPGVIGMADGRLRFTLQPGETISLIGP